MIQTEERAIVLLVWAKMADSVVDAAVEIIFSACFDVFGYPLQNLIVARQSQNALLTYQHWVYHPLLRGQRNPRLDRSACLRGSTDKFFTPRHPLMYSRCSSQCTPPQACACIPRPRDHTIIIATSCFYHSAFYYKQLVYPHVDFIDH